MHCFKALRTVRKYIIFTRLQCAVPEFSHQLRFLLSIVIKIWVEKSKYCKSQRSKLLTCWCPLTELIRASSKPFCLLHNEVTWLIYLVTCLIYLYIYICVYDNLLENDCIYIYIHIYIYIYVYVCICINTYIYLYICINI